MRVRKQSPSGDYVFGHSKGDFLIDNPAAVAQLIQTRLLLIEGEWFLNTTEGTPYTTDILGTGTQSLYDQAIQSRILGTPNVLQISAYSSALSPSRLLTVTATVLTAFSAQPVTVNVTL